MQLQGTMHRSRHDPPSLRQTTMEGTRPQSDWLSRAVWCRRCHLRASRRQNITHPPEAQMKRWCTIAINNLPRIHPESIRWMIHSPKTPSQRATSILESLVLTRGTPRSLAAAASLGKSHHHGRPWTPGFTCVGATAGVNSSCRFRSCHGRFEYLNGRMPCSHTSSFPPSARLLSPVVHGGTHPAVLEKRFRPLNERDLETQGHTGETGLGRPELGVGCHRLAEGTPSRLSHGPGKDANLKATIGNIRDDM